MSDLYLEQQRIEEEATLVGVRRATKALEKAKEKEREAASSVGSAMVKRIVGPMEALYLQDLEARAAGKATRGGSLLKVLRDVDPTLLCLAATRAALNRMSRPTKLTALAHRIGEALEDELRWHRWEKINKKQAQAVRLRVNQSTSPRQRHAALAGFARRWESKAVAEAWTTYRLVGVGVRFVDYLVRLGVFEMTKIATRRPGKKRSAAHAVQLTISASVWVKEMADFLAVSRPLSWPLVIPPVPWTAPSGGGFHFREGIEHPSAPVPLRPLPLVRRACKEQKEMLAKADLSTVYAGVNAAQATAWRINPRIYSVFTKLLEIGTDSPGLTALNPKEVPGRLPDKEAKNKEKLIAHKNEIRKAKLANSKMVSKRFAQHRIYSTAKRFVTYPAIYFAYNLDFRGRVYACSDDLSPQGNDLQRGLLEFAKGDPLDEPGVEWLKVHLANTYGVDKVSFEERQRWASAHHHMILAVASDPLDHTEWHDADQPWQFLAACFAWADYAETGLGTICRVPVMFDGSCSGIQHYAALLRDEVAGAAVNLVPSDKPGDLYADVSTEVMALLSKSREPFSQEWHAWGIDRKIVKRSVMVLPYGGTFLSNLDYVRDSVRERVESTGAPPWLTEENEQDAYVALAKIVWQAMKVVVKGPMEGMNYVRKLVKEWGSYRPRRKLHWTAPSGFPVVADYLARRVSSQVVEGEVNGSALSVVANAFTDVTNWTRVESAAAPNFVHSLDASHLLLSLKRANAEGITQLATVHDAFGTTPTKTGRFAQILREEFARIYISDPFECLQMAARAVGVTPPESPARGTLSIEGIRDAKYLFA